jgi:hypothetical protein
MDRIGEHGKFQAPATAQKSVTRGQILAIWVAAWVPVMFYRNCLWAPSDSSIVLFGLIPTILVGSLVTVGRILRDSIRAIRGDQSWLKANWIIHLVIIGSLVAVFVIPSSRLGKRVRFQFDQHAIESTMHAVERSCKEPSLPQPTFRSKPVRAFSCANGVIEFEVGTTEAFFSIKTWGFARSVHVPTKRLTDPVNIARTDVTYLGSSIWLWFEGQPLFG